MPVFIKLGPFEADKPENYAFINPEFIASITSIKDDAGNRKFHIFMVGDEDPYIVSMDVFEEFMLRCKDNTVSFVCK